MRPGPALKALRGKEFEARKSKREMDSYSRSIGSRRSTQLRSRRPRLGDAMQQSPEDEKLKKSLRFMGLSLAVLMVRARRGGASAGRRLI